MTPNEPTWAQAPTLGRRLAPRGRPAPGREGVGSGTVATDTLLPCACGGPKWTGQGCGGGGHLRRPGRASGDDPDPGCARWRSPGWRRLASWSRRRFPVVDGPSSRRPTGRLGHDAPNVPSAGSGRRGPVDRSPPPGLGQAVRSGRSVGIRQPDTGPLGATTLQRKLCLQLAAAVTGPTGGHGPGCRHGGSPTWACCCGAVRPTPRIRHRRRPEVATVIDRTFARLA